MKKNKFYLVEYFRNGFVEERSLFKTEKEAEDFVKSYGLEYMAPSRYCKWIDGSPRYAEIVTLELKVNEKIKKNAPQA